MNKKIIGTFLCMLMIAPVFTLSVAADQEIEIEIKGGYGIDVNIVNVGDTPINQYSIWCNLKSKLFNRETLKIVESDEPLIPGESYSDLFILKSLFPLFRLSIMFGTITVTVYDVVPGEWPIVDEKSVDVFYFCGFVKILSE